EGVDLGFEDVAQIACPVALLVSDLDQVSGRFEDNSAGPGSGSGDRDVLGGDVETIPARRSVGARVHATVLVRPNVHPKRAMQRGAGAEKLDRLGLAADLVDSAGRSGGARREHRTDVDGVTSAERSVARSLAHHDLGGRDWHTKGAG